MKTRLCIACIVAAGAATGGCGWFKRDDASANDYRIARIERGDLVQTVRASGTVQPIRLVQVGTQVNGPVQKLYVDYNDPVKQGDLVAQIDPTVYEARYAQDQATLSQRKAEVDQATARLSQADKELTRARELVKRDMLSQSELDTAVANRDALAAQLEVAKASVELGQASLRMSKANLDYTTIRSPVDGVVLARNVSEGQTVVASMSAQVLFQIATDLREVQVEASVPEADIGRIREGQPVSFTVDAHDQEFTGTVSQVRMAASTVQNVVTYPVVILAGNPERKLFPGMTANITCEVARRSGALKVPNAALRFKPAAAASPAGGAPVVAAPAAEAAATNAAAAAGSSTGLAGAVVAGPGDRPGGRSRGPGGWTGRGGPGGGAGPAPGSRSAGKIWIQPAPGADPVSLAVKTGISDGIFTEVAESDAVREGLDVIVGTAAGDAGSGQGTVNPFAPRFPGGSRRR